MVMSVLSAGSQYEPRRHSQARKRRMSAVHRVTVFSATQRARELYGNALAKYLDLVESRQYL